MTQEQQIKIAVVIPCYKVAQTIETVLSSIPECIDQIYCVNDACPDGSLEVIRKNKDPRVKSVSHKTNQGVGSATVTGYRLAIEEGMDIVVKIDGDAQMDPSLIPLFVRPIIEGECDYTKGNRFYRIDDVRAMPSLRLFGNAVLSFMTKMSSGYWNLFDPTNGYIAIHTSILKEIPLQKLSKRYFFESDMLFRLNTVHAVIQDIPMRALYGEEESNLKISKILFPFLRGHARNFIKRIFYNYFLRDFNAASIELVLGFPLLVFGIIFSLCQWGNAIEAGREASAGTVMLGALPVILGLQFLLSFLQYDIRSVPNVPIHNKLKGSI